MGKAKKTQARYFQQRVALPGQQPTCCYTTHIKHFEIIIAVTFRLGFTREGAPHSQKTHFGGKDHQPNSRSQLLCSKEWLQHYSISLLKTVDVENFI